MEGLAFEIEARSKGHGVLGCVEAFVMPLVDMARERTAEEVVGGRGRRGRVVADLDPSLGMSEDGLPEVARRPADGERMTPRPQEAPDAAGSRVLLVEDDQNGAQRVVG